MTLDQQRPGPVPEDFRAFVEQANEGMLIVDPDLRLLYANQWFLDLMQYPEGDVIGRPVTDFMDLGNTHKVEAERDRRRTGERSHYDVEIQTASGETRMLHVAASPRMDADGNFLGAFAIVSDKTELISLERKLEEHAHDLEAMVRARTDALISAEERFQNMFESVNDGIMRVDRAGTILLCNQALADMLGSSPGIVMSKNMMELVHEDDRELVLEISRKRLRGEPQPLHQIYRLRRLDNAEGVFVETSSSLTHKAGAIDSVQIIARDVTERIEAEEALKRAYAELKGLSQAKTNFLSNITHELKTPLVTIRGYAQMLHGGTLGPVTDEQRKALETSLKNTDVLLAQIERLLSVTRLELDDSALRFEAVRVCDLLRDCCQATGPLAGQKQIELRVEEALDDLPPVRGDWVKLHEALEHLIVNGIKFNEPGGRVEVGARQMEDGSVRLHVRDTGMGLEPERMDKLFEPFEQADGTHTRDYEGLGIGLSLVRRIVEAHEGTLGVDSILGEGTTFWCELPVSEDTPASHRPPVKSTFAALWDVSADHEADEDDEEFDADDFDLDDGGDAPVVFVDHDESMLQLLEKAFVDADVTVDIITRPGEVLSRLRGSGARVVFLDVSFPEADGVEICRNLKTDPDTAGIPVYVFTGHNREDVRDRARAAGADGFITKPVSLEYLFEVAEHHK